MLVCLLGNGAKIDSEDLVKLLMIQPAHGLVGGVSSFTHSALVLMLSPPLFWTWCTPPWWHPSPLARIGCPPPCRLEWVA